MNIKKLLQSFLLAMICLSLLTGVSLGQQPFGSDPGDDITQDAPADDVGGTLVRPSQDPEPRRPFSSPLDRDMSQGQAVLLNSKHAGWNEATTDIDGVKRVGDTLRANWIMVDENGRFEGTVVPGEGADVANMKIFLMNVGRLVQQTTLGANGRFEFNNVRQGAYSLIGWGDNGFFAFGMNILAENPASSGLVQNSIRVTAFQNATTINTDWIRYYSPQVNFRVFGRYEVGEGRDDPASLYGFMGLVENTPAATPANSISGQTVSTTEDGRLVGRIHQLNSLSGRPVDVRSTKVMLFQGDFVVAVTTIDYYGVFEFLQVPDGSYGLVAAGVDGVGMIAINVDSNAEAADTSIVDFTMISSETVGWLNHYATEVAYLRVMLAQRPQSNEQDPMAGYGCPQCGNQAGGCGACQSAYRACNCESRGISFEQWQQMGCQCNARKWGDGRFIADVAGNLRKNIEKVDTLLDRAFYPGEYGIGPNNQYNNQLNNQYNTQFNDQYNGQFNNQYNGQFNNQPGFTTPNDYGNGPNNQPLNGYGN